MIELNLKPIINEDLCVIVSQNSLLYTFRQRKPRANNSFKLPGASQVLLSLLRVCPTTHEQLNDPGEFMQIC